MPGQPMKASDLHPEYLVLGLLLRQPAHGYDLHRRLQAEYGALWRIPQNQLYGLLKRLEARGDIVGTVHRSMAGPPRRRFRLTRQGRLRFQTWLFRPTPVSVRALRMAFLTRLFLALEIDRAVAARVFESQRQAVQAGLDRLRQAAAASTESAALERLSMDLRLRQLESALQWMDEAQTRLDLIPSQSPR